MPSAQAPRQRLTTDEVARLLDQHFPQVHAGGKIIFVEEVFPGGARVTMKHHERTIRPGGTISGPAMFMLADVAVYAALLGELGLAGLQAVTTNLNINFLSRPAPKDMLANVHLIKVGRRLAVGEVELRSAGSDAIAAHAVATYSIPEKQVT